MIDLVLDDNLNYLQKMKANSVDSFIFDPPFNSKKIFTNAPNDEGEVQVLNDYWKGGMASYIHDLALRLDEMTRCLKLGGNVIIHCDDVAKYAIHYLFAEIKGLYLRNEILWSYGGGGISTKTLPKKHDTIFVFSNTGDKNKWTYNPVLKRYSKGTESIPKTSSYSGNKPLDLERGTPLTSVWDAEKENMARREVKLKDPEAWAFKPDFGSISSVTSVFGSEKTAVTEKPLPLYQRIVYIFTNEGDFIVDPYSGGGTTMLAAGMLGREGIGIDCSLHANNRAISRFKAAKDIKFKTSGNNFVNKDPDILRPHDWGAYMIGLDGGTPNPKLSDDGSVDGWDESTYTIYQAKKQSKTIGVGDVRQMHSAAIKKIEEDNWPECNVKMIVKSKYSKTAIKKAYSIKNNSIHKIEMFLLTEKDILEKHKKSTLINIDLIRSNGKIKALVDSAFKKPVVYVWIFEAEVPTQRNLFNPTPESFKKKTKVPYIEISSVKDYEKFSKVKCKVTFDDESVLVKELTIK